ncbi:hypothetical protein GCM10027051_08600 [Niabella terrae]
MASNAGTLEQLILEIAKTLEPLKDLAGPDIFARLGVPLPRAIAGNGAIGSKLGTVASKAGQLGPGISSLAAQIQSENIAGIISAGGDLIATVAGIISEMKDLGTALETAAASLTGPGKAAILELAGQMAVRMLEFCIVGYLHKKMPTLTSTLHLLGLIDKEPDVPATMEVSGSSKDPVVRRIRLDLLANFINDPIAYFKSIYDWGNPAFTGGKLLPRIQALLESAGMPAELYKIGSQPLTLDAYFFHLQTDTTVNPPGIQFGFHLPGSTTVDRNLNFSDLWKGSLHVKPAFAAGLSGTWRPPFDISLKPPTGNLSLESSLGIKAEKSGDDAVVILGLSGGSRLQAKSIGGGLNLNAQLGTAGGAVEPGFHLEIREGKLIIDFSQGDGFIQQLLSGIKLEADFGLLANWDPKNGLRLQGSGGLEVFIPLQIDLLVLEVNGLYFSLGFSNEAPLQFGLAAQLKAALGPLTAVVDRIGTRINLNFPENASGKLGMADIDFAFLPPNGVGLSLDAGPIKGGGFLKLDTEKGEYFGVLELSFQNVVDLKAIGIINTKMPDGTDGFALLILITAEFTPIQLGFGFTLNGVGGLLALNRSVNTDALKTGVRSGAVNSILFPQDVVANVNRIISDIKTIFPIVEGHFVLGPMAKIGWGTPTLISLELGVIIDIPSPQLIILGVLRCILPDEEAALLKLQVNFAGGIDFENGLWFDASLFDSRLLTFTLEGDMALRIGWGSDPVFIISVGGFHPAFKEIPNDLKSMKRLKISLLSGDNPRLSVQAYFAVTSNTVQSGAKAELYAEAAGFNVYGYLGYDLLVQFNPFHFIADIYAGLALRRGSSVICGISVHFSLSGPTPWNANGEASITILFFEISVGFDITWGDDAPAQPKELEDILPLVKTALEDERNWLAKLPDNCSTHVSQRKVELPEGRILVQPFSILSVSQKVVPLEIEINKFGNKKPAADKLFTLSANGLSTEYVQEEFAIGNYVQLKDAEKLSRKSFEKMKSGLRFQTGDATGSGNKIEKEVNYELSYVHRKKFLVIRAGIYKFFKEAFNVLVKGNAISKSKLSVSARVTANAPAAVTFKEPGYAVVNQSDLALYSPNSLAASEAEAYYIQETLIKDNPALKNKLQVVSQFEMN